jgi:hypothetical protein
VTTYWIEHTNTSGQECAKCSDCGHNVPTYYLGSDRDCWNCEDIADTVRIAEERAAEVERMTNRETLDVDEWVSITRREERWS